MQLWLLLALTFLVQEGITTTALLYKAYQSGYSPALIHILWLVVTLLEVSIAYNLGKWVKGRTSDRVERWIVARVRKLEERIGKWGERFALGFTAWLLSPALTAFCAAWLNISFRTMVTYVMIGDLFWYASEWVTIFGLDQLIANIRALI